MESYLRLHLAVIALALSYVPTASLLLAGNGSSDPIEVGTRKQLLFDDRFMQSSRGVTRTMNPPRRDGRVLIAADQPWEEGTFIGIYSSVLKEDGKVKIWYDSRLPTPDGPYHWALRTCYAESDDGLHFVKPKLGMHEMHGTKANNVVQPGIIGGNAVWIDPQAPPEHRYKTQAKVYPSSEFHMYSSPDGMRWKMFTRLNPGPGGWDTQSIVFWDPKSLRYAMYTRRWVREGLEEANYRTVRRLESDDLRQWDNQTVVMQADEIDLAIQSTPTAQPPVDFYGADVFPYSEAQDAYIMLAEAFWHWRERKPIEGLGPSSFDVRLAVSRDGKNFERAGERQPFMPTGPAGRFDSRFVWAMPHPVRMGDELWIYYVGSNRDHDRVIDPAAKGRQLTGIGRAVLRLDGFVSVDAGYGGGEFTTPPIRFSGRRLEVNAETSGGGSVAVEMLDEQGKAIPGYARHAAVSSNGNTVRMPIRWKSGEDVSALAGRPVQLRFYLRDCKLYAFQFRD